MPSGVIGFKKEVGIRSGREKIEFLQKDFSYTTRALLYPSHASSLVPVPTAMMAQFLDGVLCLGSWFAFNLWVLRDYFFPWWFAPIYTESGLSKQKLESMTQEILMKNRVSNAFVIPTSIGFPPEHLEGWLQQPPPLSDPFKRAPSQFALDSLSRYS